MRRNYKYFLLGISLLIVIFSLGFVMSAGLTSPGNVTFSGNRTSLYDEGTFSINWSAVSNANNYTIYISINSGTSFFANATNNSATGYSFSNTTEANYTFIIQAQNNTATAAANSTNVSIYVDRTAPAVSFPVYTNGTAKKNTTSLTLNIFVSDASSGLTGSVCLVDINGTNQSFGVSGGWCNITDGNLTNLADGSRQIKTYVNDTVNILGSNISVYVLMDTTVPTNSASCTSSIILGESFPCTCAGSDAGSGLNGSRTTSSSTSADDTATPTVTGDFTYSCTLYDNAGNSLASTVAYTVRGRNTGASATGGSTSATTATTATISKVESFAEITPGAATIVKDFNANTGLKEIQIEVNNPAQDVKVTITKYDGQPAAVSVEKSGKVYQYLQIKVDNIADKLDKAIITSRVNRSWVSENGLNWTNIALFKFDNSTSQWNELATEYDSEDDTYYYYTSNVTSFSYFAIGQKSLVTGETGGVTAGNETATGGVTGKIWMWIGIAASALVLAIVVIFFVRKKMR